MIIIAIIIPLTFSDMYWLRKYAPTSDSLGMI